MAFGFTPKYIEELPLGDLSNDQFMVLAIEAAKKLEWKISAITANGFVAFTGFSLVSWSEEVTLNIDNGVARLRSECNGSQFMDWGKNKKNIQELIDGIHQIKKVTTDESLLQKVEEFKLAHVAALEEETHQPKISVENRRKHFYSIFIPSEGFFATPIILNLNIAVFVLMVLTGVNVFLPDGQSLLNWGANFRPSTIDGQWWRLITNVFLHIGIIHLLMNMYALVYIGSLLEHQLGTSRFVAAYLFTGICASVASLWWHDITISAGASGAIFGLYGVFLAMLTTDLIEKSARGAMLTSIAVFVGYNLINGIKSGIDNAAHVGGLLSGLVIGYGYVRSLREPEDLTMKIKSITFIGLAVLTFSFLVYRNLPNDFTAYQTKMEEFAELESSALKASTLDSTDLRVVKLSQLKGSGIYFWNECITVLKSIAPLKLPKILLDRNGKIIEYCKLRLKRCELLIQAIEQGTQKYDAEMEQYDKEIAAMVTELTGKTEKQ